MSDPKTETVERWPSPEEVEQNAPREDGSHGLPGYGQPPEELRRKMRAPEPQAPAQPSGQNDAKR